MPQKRPLATAHQMEYLDLAKDDAEGAEVSDLLLCYAQSFYLHARAPAI
jgi:hypothetical protein